MRSVVNFNDLFKRINVLEEATGESSSAWKGAIKKSGLTPILKQYKNQKTGKGVGASSRTKNLILLRALYHKDYLSDDLFDALRRKATSSSYIANEIKKADPESFNKIFFTHTDINDDGETVEVPALIDGVLEDIKKNPNRYLDVQLTNIMGKDYKLEVELDTEEPAATAKVAEVDGEIGDVVDDLYGDYFDERYIVEIQVANPNDAVKIKGKVEPFADEDGVDMISKPGYSLVSFSFASDSEAANAKALADKVKEIGVEGLYDKLKQDVERFTDKFEIYITEPGNINIQEPTVAANKPTQDRTSFKADTPTAVDQSPDTFEVEDEQSKPDYIDLDGDGDKKESMKKAAKDKKKAEDEETVTESYTAQYLTEQPATKSKDKQLSTIQESVSFKDKMKPKTSWQLEELRRYGL
tara:strand:+ start:4508 stop:5743 length:1236 start_codon:yes stop_codon:yes gene_type:complete